MLYIKRQEMQDADIWLLRIVWKKPQKEATFRYSGHRYISRLLSHAEQLLT